MVIYFLLFPNDPFCDRNYPFRYYEKRAFNFITIHFDCRINCWFFYLVTFLNIPVTMSESYHLYLKNWFYSFIILSISRFAVFYFTFQEESYDLIQPSNKYLFGKEVSKTFQYLILAGVSILASFYTSLFSLPIMVNHKELWLNFREPFLSWFVVFLLLSLLRLSIIYIRNILFQKK